MCANIGNGGRRLQFGSARQVLYRRYLWKPTLFYNRGFSPWISVCRFFFRTWFREIEAFDMFTNLCAASFCTGSLLRRLRSDSTFVSLERERIWNCWKKYNHFISFLFEYVSKSVSNNGRVFSIFAIRDNIPYYVCSSVIVFTSDNPADYIRLIDRADIVCFFLAMCLLPYHFKLPRQSCHCGIATWCCSCIQFTFTHYVSSHLIASLRIARFARARSLRNHRHPPVLSLWLQ